MKKLFLSVLFFQAFTVMSQGWANDTRFDIGTWNTVNLKLEISPKLSVVSETQMRGQRFYDDLNYWETKAFFHYALSEQWSGGFGMGTYHQFSDYENFSGPQRQKEFRLWMEVVSKSNMGRISLDHRYRLEDRFIQKWDASREAYNSNHSTGNDDDRYRFRYRLQANIPVNHKKMEAKTFYFNVSDEVMFTHKAPFFNQNRFFTGAGYKFSHSSIQAGFMHQFLNYTATQRRKDYIQITYSHVFKIKEKSH